MRSLEEKTLGAVRRYWSCLVNKKLAGLQIWLSLLAAISQTLYWKRIPFLGKIIERKATETYLWLRYWNLDPSWKKRSLAEVLFNRYLILTTYNFEWKVSKTFLGEINAGTLGSQLLPPPPFLPRPALNQRTVQALPPLYLFFVKPPAPSPLKSRIFQWTSKILKFSSLTPSHISKVTKNS